MPQYISGKDIADIKEIEHKLRVQDLRSKGVVPKLAILQTIASPVIDTYVRVKKTYAQKIGIEVEHFDVDPAEIQQCIETLDNDASFHGIIVQLPLHTTLDKKTTLDLVAQQKDVDGLTTNAYFMPPTVQSILWLLEAHVGAIKSKKIALVGKGMLVGAPLEKELLLQGFTPYVFIKEDSLETLSQYDIIISATGTPHLIKNKHVCSGAYVFDAGTAEENGTIHGDASDELYLRDDISITPTKGGVGILTVRALFENVLQAAEKHHKNN